MIWLVLQAVAVTLIITEGSLFAVLRTFGPKLWRQLVSCSMCLGTWVGMALYEVQQPTLVFYWREVVDVLAFGCVSGCAAYTGAMIWACLDRLSGPET